MRIWWAALLLATGCGRILGIGDFQLADAAGSGRDGGGDGAIGDGALCVGNGFLGTVCLTADPPASIALGASINTDDAGACTQLIAQGTVADVCIVAAHTIAQQGTVVVTGSLPLALVALDSITIGGTLDASSGGSAQRVGAGADPASCPALIGTDNNNGGTGGAGGGLGTPGGGGGNNSGGVLGAAADNPFTPTKLRGGCPGGSGGAGGTMNNGGVGGAGGGAIYLLAGSTITIGGAIYASGGGGAGGGQNRGGGGGGGAGGFIGLEAPAIGVTGLIAANGGGGGGGGDGGAGFAGADGTTMTYSMPAAGGMPNDTKASGGGSGGALQSAAQAGMNDANCCGGAGGGGGGIGIIWVKGTLSGTQISPTPTLH